MNEKKINISLRDIQNLSWLHDSNYGGDYLKKKFIM